MLLVATVGCAVASETVSLSSEIRALGDAVATLAIVGTVGIGLLMIPAVTGPRVRGWLARIPVIGPTLVRLFEAAAVYRHERRYLFAAIGISCCTHTLLVLAIWCVGRGLPVTAPSLPVTFLVGPLSLCAGAIPLTPGGLGTFETAMNQLYEAVGSQPGDGLLVAIAYRVMVYLMAAAGAVYYLSARRTVDQVMHEAEELQEELEHEPR